MNFMTYWWSKRKNTLLALILTFVGVLASLLSPEVRCWIGIDCSTDSATTIKYSVHVEDAETHTSISNAEVTLEIGGSAPVSRKTDSNGNAIIQTSEVQMGKLATLIVEAPGYHTYDEHVNLNPDNLTKHIELEVKVAASPSPSTLIPTQILTPTLTPELLVATETTTSPGRLCDDLEVYPIFRGQMREMVEVPAGISLRGSTDDDLEYYIDICGRFGAGCHIGDFFDEKPQRKIYLDTFWIDRFEVTNQQFQEFVQAEGYSTTAELKGVSQVWNDNPDIRQFEDVPGANWMHPEGPGSSIVDRMDHPVVHISWQDAAAYCNYVDKILPTEAQWEKAARGPDSCRFPWGDDWDSTSISRVNIIRTTQAMSTVAVTEYERGDSPYGARNMLGNVGEWVFDWFDPTFYETSTFTNPVHLNQFNELDERGWRGGNFATKAGFAHVSWRKYAIPTYSNNVIGFRCAHDPQ